ncbi:hypothetical protein BA896_016545 [Janthinobacterium lividum]|uniref:Uncharacterized protein n=2 Tax=Janthinobacterium TaxID=29580 RepID=A0A1E8PM59_9BURK|nr:hypothetical protein BA896_016545 [Janthinobacterium lividum]
MFFIIAYSVAKEVTMQPQSRHAPLRAHSTPEPDIGPPPEGDPLMPPLEKPPYADPVPVEEPTPPPPPVKMA